MTALNVEKYQPKTFTEEVEPYLCEECEEEFPGNQLYDVAHPSFAPEYMLCCAPCIKKIEAEDPERYRALTSPVSLPPEQARLAREFPKKHICALGPVKFFSEADWKKLPLKYTHRDEFAESEARDCACGSTLVVLTKIIDLSKE